MKIILKIFKTIFMIIFLILLVVNIILLTSVYVFKSEYPNVFGYTYFEVLTGSMRDEIKEHDIVIVKLNEKNYQIGDIVTYKGKSNLITHRVVEKNGNIITTKGDANNTNDEPISREKIIGKVVKILNKVGILIKVITDKVTIILVFSMILVFSYIMTLLERG